MGVCRGTAKKDVCGRCDGHGLDFKEYCDCHENVLDACGVCGGPGIPEGDCDCTGGKADDCGVCRGVGIVAPFCDCEKHTLDSCLVCGGPGLEGNKCDCNGKEWDECDVCGGTGVPDGWVDCTTEKPEGPEKPNLCARVIEEGGACYDTWIRVTLLWENCNDLDLSVIEPDMVDMTEQGYTIDYKHRTSTFSMGGIDIDKNAVRC